MHELGPAMNIGLQGIGQKTWSLFTACNFRNIDKIGTKFGMFPSGMFGMFPSPFT